MRVLNCAFDHSMEPEEKAVIPLAGGIMQHGYQCGMIWGAALAAGAQAYRLFGPGPQAETAAIIAAQRLVESFRALKNNVNCLEITGLDKSSSAKQMMMYFFIKGGVIGCFRQAARYAQEAYGEINIALSEKHVKVPAPPVSCAAMLAKKMGLSDMHTVMAAGFAGGIGLSGSACGALGAAIWIMGMNNITEGDAPIDFQDRIALETVDRFMKCTGDKFECTEIVGRKFENIDDHAGYLRDGGCSKIIQLLAAQ
ncbi:MAG: C_GCAxxG_C_C family protein [Chloroflexi bacterium]|nr:C_GCAxxG_C_C family protein [Chloroflexota bacterium]